MWSVSGAKAKKLDGHRGHVVTKTNKNVLKYVLKFPLHRKAAFDKLDTAHIKMCDLSIKRLYLA